MNDAPQAMLVDYAEKVSAPCNSGRGERLDLEIKDLSGTEVALIYKAVKQINEARSIAPATEPKP